MDNVADIIEKALRGRVFRQIEESIKCLEHVLSHVKVDTLAVLFSH